ncbi:hypothetical protein BKA70DRAFT_1424498 [Coprinopsis sp. MPI-PUGE-AT-0042]|nr:hypothetical protein BKA70DRAFT_1424498 [Coprinopsis sp. MPI-PUGE-AT-0042]
MLFQVMDSFQAPHSCGLAEAPEPVLDWQPINDATSLSNHSNHIFHILNALHGEQVHCADCQFSFCQRFAPIISSMPELLDGIDAALLDTPGHEEAALELANPVEQGRICVKLARLQVRYALGMLLDSMACLDHAEAVAHSVLHRSPALHPVYTQVSHGVREGMYLKANALHGNTSAF